jgi:hypothetical protein
MAQRPPANQKKGRPGIVPLKNLKHLRRKLRVLGHQYPFRTLFESRSTL